MLVLSGFWGATIKKAKEFNTEERTLPKKEKRPMRYEDGQSEGHFPTSPKEYYQKVYYEALDLIVQCIVHGCFNLLILWTIDDAH